MADVVAASLGFWPANKRNPSQISWPKRGFYWFKDRNLVFWIQPCLKPIRLFCMQCITCYSFIDLFVMPPQDAIPCDTTGLVICILIEIQVSTDSLIISLWKNFINKIMMQSMNILRLLIMIVVVIFY